MINRAELQAKLYEVGLEEHAAILAEHARPAIYIEREVIADENQLPHGTSRLGGSPDVPAGFSWPHHNNRPLIFLAQFNLAEVSPFDIDHLLPTEGTLYFFYDRLHGEAGITLYHPGDNTMALIRHPHPQHDDNVRPLPAALLTFRTEWSFPSNEYLHNSVGVEIEGLHDGELDLYDLLHLSPQFPHHTLLGHPYEIQGDVRYEVLMEIHNLYAAKQVQQWITTKLGEEWLLLFQMDTDDGADSLHVMWGDAGMLYFMLTRSALEQHDFAASRVIMQCY